MRRGVGFLLLGFLVVAVVPVRAHAANISLSLASPSPILTANGSATVQLDVSVDTAGCDPKRSFYIQINIHDSSGQNVVSSGPLYDDRGGPHSYVVTLRPGQMTEAYTAQAAIYCPNTSDTQQLVVDSGVVSFTVCRAAVDLSADGKTFIKNEEGCVKENGKKKPRGSPCLSEYDNDGSAEGNCTIGWGHLLHTGKCKCKAAKSCANKAEKPFYKGISEAEAERLFNQDTSQYSELVKSLLPRPVNQCQLDALTDFFFNLGGHAYRKKGTHRATIITSDLLNGDYQSIPSDMGLYDKKNKGVHDRHLADAKKFAMQHCGNC
jgi:GH24 family phage-related lysozyme (muramidase)